MNGLVLNERKWDELELCAMEQNEIKMGRYEKKCNETGSDEKMEFN